MRSLAISIIAAMLAITAWTPTVVHAGGHWN